jgi:hypothetical protein
MKRAFLVMFTLADTSGSLGPPRGRVCAGHARRLLVGKVQFFVAQDRPRKAVRVTLFNLPRFCCIWRTKLVI